MTPVDLSAGLGALIFLCETSVPSRRYKEMYPPSRAWHAADGRTLESIVTLWLAIKPNVLRYVHI